MSSRVVVVVVVVVVVCVCMVPTLAEPRRRCWRWRWPRAWHPCCRGRGRRFGGVQVVNVADQRPSRRLARKVPFPKAKRLPPVSRVFRRVGPDHIIAAIFVLATLQAFTESRRAPQRTFVSVPGDRFTLGVLLHERPFGGGCACVRGGRRAAWVAGFMRLCMYACADRGAVAAG